MYVEIDGMLSEMIIFLFLFKVMSFIVMFFNVVCMLFVKI